MKNIKQVLIISASDQTVQSVKNCLDEHQYSLFVAESACKASEILSNQRIKLVLFDNSLGDEYTKIALTSEVPVIFLLEDDRLDVVNRIYQLGACDFIRLPIKKSILLSRMDTQIRILEGVNEVKKSNIELYDFCMPASLDLKAPFSVISSLCRIMMEEMNDKLTDKLILLLSNIDCAALQITQIIEENYNHAQAESCHTGGYVRMPKVTT